MSAPEDGQPMQDEWRANLILTDNGAINPYRANNTYLFLKHHPEMVGVLGMRNGSVCLLARPPWSNVQSWQARSVTDNDYFAARVWLENQGLMPNRRMVKDAICAVAGL